jgi:hypothetical protein
MVLAGHAVGHEGWTHSDDPFTDCGTVPTIRFIREAGGFRRPGGNLSVAVV